MKRIIAIMSFLVLSASTCMADGESDFKIDALSWMQGCVALSGPAPHHSQMEGHCVAKATEYCTFHIDGKLACFAGMNSFFRMDSMRIRALLPPAKAVDLRGFKLRRYQKSIEDFDAGIDSSDCKIDAEFGEQLCATLELSLAWMSLRSAARLAGKAP